MTDLTGPNHLVFHEAGQNRWKDFEKLFESRGSPIEGCLNEPAMYRNMSDVVLRFSGLIG